MVFSPMFLHCPLPSTLLSHLLSAKHASFVSSAQPSIYANQSLDELYSQLRDSTDNVPAMLAAAAAAGAAAGAGAGAAPANLAAATGATGKLSAFVMQTSGPGNRCWLALFPGCVHCGKRAKHMCCSAYGLIVQCFIVPCT